MSTLTRFSFFPFFSLFLCRENNLNLISNVRKIRYTACTFVVDTPNLSLTSPASGFFVSCRAPFQGFTGRVLYEETEELADTRNLIRVLHKKNCFFDMSWDIQRPGGDQGMPPSVVQPCISHEQLLSNRDGETDRYNLGVYFGFWTTFFFVFGLRGENRDF